MRFSNVARAAPLPETDFGALSGYHGPKGFHWLIRGCLAGMSRPGLIQPIEADLQGLVRMGTDVLVTLTDEWEPDTKAIEKEGLISQYVPIPDMCPPTLDQTIEICATVADDIAAKRRVVYHCKAGRGRTGTLLAAQLIWHGATAEQAIGYTKHRNQLWIESDMQMQFIQELPNRLTAINP